MRLLFNHFLRCRFLNKVSFITMKYLKGDIPRSKSERKTIQLLFIKYIYIYLKFIIIYKK